MKNSELIKVVAAGFDTAATSAQRSDAQIALGRLEGRIAMEEDPDLDVERLKVAVAALYGAVSNTEMDTPEDEALRQKLLQLARELVPNVSEWTMQMQSQTVSPDQEEDA